MSGIRTIPQEPLSYDQLLLFSCYEQRVTVSCLILLSSFLSTHILQFIHKYE